MSYGFPAPCTHDVGPVNVADAPAPEGSKLVRLPVRLNSSNIPNPSKHTRPCFMQNKCSNPLALMTLNSQGFVPMFCAKLQTLQELYSCLHIYIYIYVIYIYIYIIYACMCIYIYIYTCVICVSRLAPVWLSLQAHVVGLPQVVPVVDEHAVGAAELLPEALSKSHLEVSLGRPRLTPSERHRIKLTEGVPFRH